MYTLIKNSSSKLCNAMKALGLRLKEIHMYFLSTIMLNGIMPSGLGIKKAPFQRVTCQRHATTLMCFLVNCIGIVSQALLL